MARGQERNGAAALAHFDGWFRMLLQQPPSRFTAFTFMKRVRQHLIVYMTILIVSLYTCMFIAVPVETALGSVFLIGAGAIITLTISSSGQRPYRLVNAMVASTYIAGAAVLLILASFLAQGMDLLGSLLNRL